MAAILKFYTVYTIHIKTQQLVATDQCSEEGKKLQ